LEITEGIIKEVESGNRKIVLDLYHHSFNVLMSSAVRYKNNKEDQMEIVNNAFMKIVTNIDKYKPGTAYFSWIKTIVQREIIDDFRVADAIQSAASTQTISGNLTVTGTFTADGGVTGSQIGIQSAGTVVGTAKTLNFIGTGNTFLDNGDGTVDVSISGSGGGGLGTAINYSDGTASPFSYIDRFTQVSEDLLLNAENAGVSTSIIVSVSPNIEINSGIAVTVGAGKTMIIDVLQIGDL